MQRPTRRAAARLATDPTHAAADIRTRDRRGHRLWSRCGAWIAAVALVALAPAGGAVASELRWRNGTQLQARTLDSAQLQSALGEARQGAAAQRRVVVRFDGPLSKQQRSELDAAGLRLLTPLGAHHYFASLAPNLNPGRAASVAGLVDVAPVAVEYKLHADLIRGTVHPWMVIPADAVGTPAATAQGAPRTIAVYVLFHRDADLDRVPGRLAALGGKVASWMRPIHGVVAWLPENAIRSLAADDDVMYLEPPLPQWSELNDSNRTVTQVDQLQNQPYDLDGSGVTVMIYDGGRMFEHGDFGSRLTIGPSDTAGISDHATHVGGTVAGSGNGSGGQYRGMAPGASLISYGFQVSGGLSAGFLYSDPGDLSADYTEAIAMGADVSNNSIGSNVAPNGFPCEWEGDYGVTAALIDAVARGGAGAPIRIVWSNGNERNSANCGQGFYSTPPPANAKNSTTVGALNSNNDSVTSFTSWGPSDDGRLQPDVSGPGCQSSVDFGVTSTSAAGGYNVKCGTSMSGPTVAGIVALLLQQFRISYPESPDPASTSMTAILAHSAADVGNAGPDYQSGYGSVRAKDAADILIEERFLEAEVGQGETQNFVVVVGENEGPLKVTIAWDDPPGMPNVDPVLVNDLDLRVIDPQGGVHFPWTLDPANPGDPAVRTVPDRTNNIEQVVIDDPAPGAYQVEVVGFNLGEGGTQRFGVVGGPSLIQCGSRGLLLAERSRVTCNDTLEISVIDCDPNVDDLVSESFDISVTSPGEPLGESLTLTESGPATSKFEGQMPISSSDAPGTLLVAHDDTITATYVDLDDGAGQQNVARNTQIVVDCQLPSIQSVTMSNIDFLDATVEIRTDEESTARVFLGSSCGVAVDAFDTSDPTTVHQVRLTGLTEDTPYVYWVEVQDVAGNLLFDDNQGSCYAFSTLDVPNYFTEEFSSGGDFDLEGTTLVLTPTATVDQYDACMLQAYAGLPVDPTGGAEVLLGDDDSAQIDLDNAAVQLYGQSYSTLWIGSNGYVTFTAPDTDGSPSLNDHFDTPRVSALFRDHNIGPQTIVSWKQLSDRLAITWENVTANAADQLSTFQLELLFDGTVRVTWLRVDAGNGVVGLSNGAGLSPVYLPSNFSGRASCGDLPPFARDVSAATPANTAVDVALDAIDDGAPIDKLIYRVETLPAVGTLIDLNSGSQIVAVPHNLPDGISGVRYQPAADFQGADSFRFRVNDGGAAPSGGLSNVAEVAIAIGTAEDVQQFLTDNTNPQWDDPGLWAYGRPLGNGSQTGDPTSGFTGDNVYGYNRLGDYIDNMGEEYLTSTPFDLTGVFDAALEFRRWLGVQSATQDNAAIQVSIDGTTWQDVWVHTGPAIFETDWSLQSIPLPDLVDDQPAVQLRWVMGAADGDGTSFGWNIDDIRIRGLVDIPVDCDATNPNVIRAPGRVTAVQLTQESGQTRVRWQDQSAATGSGTTYDLLGGDLGGGAAFSLTGSCLQSSGAAEHLDVRPDPQPGQGFWYLVRAWNSCGGSSLGDATRDGQFVDANANGATDVCE